MKSEYLTDFNEDTLSLLIVEATHRIRNTFKIKHGHFRYDINLNEVFNRRMSRHKPSDFRDGFVIATPVSFRLIKRIDGRIKKQRGWALYAELPRSEPVEWIHVDYKRIFS